MNQTSLDAFLFLKHHANFDPTTSNKILRRIEKWASFSLNMHALWRIFSRKCVFIAQDIKREIRALIRSLFGIILIALVYIFFCSGLGILGMMAIFPLIRSTSIVMIITCTITQAYYVHKTQHWWILPYLDVYDEFLLWMTLIIIQFFVLFLLNIIQKIRKSISEEINNMTAHEKLSRMSKTNG